MIAAVCADYRAAFHLDRPLDAQDRSAGRRITCPVLVLWGGRDRQVSVEDGFEYARRLRAPLRVIADCGHLLIGERPEACADAIEEFLPRDGLLTVAAT